MPDSKSQWSAFEDSPDRGNSMASRAFRADTSFENSTSVGNVEIYIVNL